jgi:intracellular sulfur oxidation DsrE/DsrF family protein
MKNWFKRKIDQMDLSRRKALSQLAAGGGLLALGMSSSTKAAAKEESELDDLRFPGDEPEHKVVYQFNHADKDYQNHVIFSVGAVLRKYEDNIKIVVTCFGPGLHILAKKPGRPVSKEIQQRVSSLNAYGVEFHACGNTMKSLKWTKKDLVDFAEVVEVGASDLIELQEQGYSYISW